MTADSTEKMVVAWRNEASPPEQRWVVSLDDEGGGDTDIIGRFPDSESATRFATETAERRNLRLVLCD